MTNNEENRNLLIPVYLNQRVVFDLLAMLDNGIATVTRVSTTNEIQRTSGNSGENFALEKTLSSLLKVNSGDVAISQKEERIHTPASLFHKLLNKLSQGKQITVFNAETQFSTKAGCIVQFESQLVNSSLPQVLKKIIGLFELIPIVQKFSPELSKKNQKEPHHNIGDIIKKLQSFLDKLEQGNTTDIVTEPFNKGWRAILTLEKQYLNDINMLDLSDGHFKVVGKVTRILEASASPISLLRNTPLDFLPPASIADIEGVFRAISSSEQIKFPKIQLEIPVPIVQIIPIAIFT